MRPHHVAEHGWTGQVSGQVGQQIRHLTGPGGWRGDGLPAQDVPTDLDRLGRAVQARVQMPRELQDADGAGLAAAMAPASRLILGIGGISWFVPCADHGI